MGIPPIVGNFDGDKIADAILLGGTPSAPSLQYVGGKQIFGAQPFDPPIELLAEPAIYAPFFAAVQAFIQATDLPRPYVQSLTQPNGQSLLAILVDAVGPPGAPTQPNALLLLPEGAPGVVTVPDLRVGAGESDRNFTFDDIDGDGSLDLLVSPPPDAQGKINLQAYRLGLDANGLPTLSPLLRPSGSPYPFPTNCAMPTNRARLIDLDGDTRPDFVCLRPGTIDVYLAESASPSFDARVRSQFPFAQASDPALQGSAENPFYPWASRASFVDLTGDDRPDYVNTAFPSQVWYRPNLGKGQFGPMELWETPAISNAAGTQSLGLDYALSVEALPPAANGAQQPHVLAFTNGYPAAAPPGEAPAPGAQTVTMVKFPYRPLDADGDAIADILDNAASFPNPDQADANADGVGDVVDAVPCGPDADKDGIIDSVPASATDCLGKAIDNCVGRANSSQKNGNDRAERANDARVLGDACDPAPHAVPLPLWANTAAPSSPTTTTCGTAAGSGATQVCLSRGLGYRTLVGIQVKTQGKRSLPELPDAVEGTVNVDRTNFRFCVERADGDPVSCADAAFASARLIDSTAPRRGLEHSPPSAAAPWRRVSVDGLTNPAPGGTLPYDGVFRGLGGAGQDYRSNAPFPQRTWSWSSDIVAWRSSFGTSYPFGGVDDIEGVFAIHAETTAGSAPDATYGVHGKHHNPAQAATNLSVGAAVIDGLSIGYFRLLPTAKEWRVRPVASLVSWLPLAAGACGTASELCRTAKPRSALPIYRHTVPGFVGLVDEDGTIREVGSSISDPIRELYASSDLVLVASEPSDEVGGRAYPPRVVGLTADGARLRGVLAMSNGALSYRGLSECSEGCFPFLTASARGAAPGVSDDPPTHVYAGSLETVFRLRGGGTPELSFMPLSSGNWTTVPWHGRGLGRVVSATFHAFDRRLWVLEESGRGFARRMRLLRISPFDATVEELASFPRLGLFDAHWLASDHDGRILVAASSAAARKHTLVSLSSRDDDGVVRLDVDGVYFGDGELLAAPRISSAELALVVQRSAQQTPRLVTHAGFPGGKGSLTHLGGCF